MLGLLDQETSMLKKLYQVAGTAFITVFTVIFTLSFTALSTEASTKPRQTRTSQQWRAYFDRAQSDLKRNLGPQCQYKTESAFEKFEKSIINTDVLLSHEDFMSEVNKRGLLGVDLFVKYMYPDKHTTIPVWEQRQEAQGAIQGIVNAVNYFVDHGLVGTKETCFMTANEVFALFYYTGEGYKILNGALRENEAKNDAEETHVKTDLLKKLAVIGNNLDAALEMMQPYVGTVKRGQRIGRNPEKDKVLLASLEKGKSVTWESYISTTVYQAFEGEIQYVINVHKNCYYIADFSIVEQDKVTGFSQFEEEEVLCKPYQKFLVLDNDANNGRHNIILEQK